MNYHVAILGYRDFIDLTRGIIEEINKNVKISVFQCFLNECLDVLPRLHPQTDIIITGNANKAFLQDKTDIPIISFRITPLDILSAIKKALPYSKNIAIALANFEDLEYDYAIFQEVLNIKLTLITYNTQKELRQKMKEFALIGGAVIGTTVAVNVAKDYGLHGELIYSLERSINESVDRAIELIEFKQQEERRTKELKTIIDSSSDGVIVTNELNDITLINNAMKNLLKTDNINVSTGTNLESVLSPHVIKDLMNNPSTQNKIIHLGNRTLSVSRTPIYIKNSKEGNVITFQDIKRIQKIEQKYRLETEAKGLIARTHFSDVIYSKKSPMNQTIKRAKLFSKAESTVLIIGETGTGKELLAQSIHNHSNRSNYPFVAINCSALPETLLESELFGYEQGAFTGASKKGKKGLFELAHKGTIFLDEINSISLNFQARLLRVLQEKEIKRIGSESVIPIDVRIIAASNVDLVELVQKQSFRSDLYYRLNVLKLNVPSLKERIEDLIPLAKHFILLRNKRIYDFLEPFIDGLFEELYNHDFPGNIRELENIIERFTVLLQASDKFDQVFLKELLMECIDKVDYGNTTSSDLKLSFPIKDSYRESLYEAEKKLMEKYLDLCHGNKVKLSEKLGLSKSTLYRKLKELKINQ